MKRYGRYKHGQRWTPEYRAWGMMKSRCSNQKLAGWKNYGGRGISISADWRDSFEAFLSDMGKRPSPGHSLERINNDGNYEADNCKWATRKEQRANQRPRVEKRVRANSTSGIPGVIFWKARNKWKTVVRARNLRYNFGCYVAMEDAFAARNAAMEALWDRFSEANPSPFQMITNP